MKTVNLFTGIVVLLLVSCGDPSSRITTTSPQLAEENLHSQINSLYHAIEKRPNELQLRSNLIQLLQMRTQYLGTYLTDFAEMVRLAEESIQLFPDEAKAWMDHAFVNSSLHHFTTAMDDLNKALELGADEAKINKSKATIYLATGESLDWVGEIYGAALERERNFETLTRMAGYEGEIGNFAQADSYYEEALSLYRDASPFPLAWVAFQRGVMWGEKAADVKRAEALYEESLDYFPKYVVANVHYSEILSHTDPQSAIARAKNTLSYTEDPEPAGFAGEVLLLSSGESAESRELIERAAQGYEQLLANYERAFRDHGAEFFMGPGKDPSRALSLALRNLEERKNERAYVIAMEAAHLAEEISTLCRIREEFQSREPKQIVSHNAISAYEANCSTSTP